MTHEITPVSPGRLPRVQLAACSALALALLLGAAPAHAQPIFQANSADAGSEFSGNYLIENTLNGTGMPAGFDIDDVHAPYARGNHWTTSSGAIMNGTAWAIYYFDSPVALTHFHMWNHQSNGGLASNAFYGVTEFNLFLRDDNGDNLFSLLGQSAIGTAGYSEAQSYQFARVTGVSQVRFEILNNANNGASFTGLAEVAFSDFEQVAVVPEPASVALLASGLLALAGVHHRRKKLTR